MARTSFKLADNGDYYYENGKRVLITDDDEIIKRLGFKLKRFFGEWFLDSSKGIDYYNKFLIKFPNFLECELILRNEIINTEGIARIKELKIIKNPNREIKVKFTAVTVNNKEFTNEDKII